jgi:hypothetical protein
MSLPDHFPLIPQKFSGDREERFEMGPFYESVDFISMCLVISRASDPTKSIKLMRNFGDAGDKIGQNLCRSI